MSYYKSFVIQDQGSLRVHALLLEKTFSQQWITFRVKRLIAHTVWPCEKVLICVFLKRSCHDAKDGQHAALCKCDAAQLKLEGTYLSPYYFSLSVYFSLFPILPFKDWSFQQMGKRLNPVCCWKWKYLLMIQWSMMAFWRSAGNVLFPTQCGQAFHPPVQLTSTSAKTVFGSD